MSSTRMLYFLWREENLICLTAMLAILLLTDSYAIPVNCYISFSVSLHTDLKTLPVIFDADRAPFLRLTGQFNNTLPRWRVTQTLAAVTAWPCVQRGGSGWHCASRSCLSRTVHPATPVINTQLSLPARACQNLWTRQQPFKGFSLPSPLSSASTQAPAKRPLLVVVTTQYSDLCWSTKLIWWSSPSQFNTTEQKSWSRLPIKEKRPIYGNRKWHQKKKKN